MIKVMKVLKIAATGDNWADRLTGDRQVLRLRKWVNERCQTLSKLHTGRRHDTSQVIMWFHFTDPAEATWFTLSFDRAVKDTSL